MARRYNKRILSDELAALGEKLGRAPKPSDLVPEMASKKTYLRHFSNWEEALEYAGFVNGGEGLVDADGSGDTSKNSSKTPILAESVEDAQDGWSDTALINLYKTNVVFTGIFGNPLPIPCSGIAKASVRRYNTSAEKRLSKITGSIPVSSYYYDDILVHKQDGSCSPLPPPSIGTYLLVSHTVAKAAFRLGRPTWDLVFPDKFHWHDSTIYIESLELLYKKSKRDFSQDDPPT